MKNTNLNVIESMLPFYSSKSLTFSGTMIDAYGFSIKDDVATNSKDGT
ncbi:MAG: hypothetical protein ISR65_09220 [Bacteriovoracaceae bacterium]|nr:hypothetical protein [Bacteriovoracaceae bacterium]